MSEETAHLDVTVHANKVELGKAAAEFVAATIAAAIASRGEARVIFATGASQFELLEELVKLSVEWDKVVAFHLDEYVGLDAGHPASFRRYLNNRLFGVVEPRMKAVNLMDPSATEAYAKLLLEAPIDLACVGFGENAHLAFNDPPADFDDPLMVKVVELDHACRKQQVGEGWFPTIDDTPTHAATLTIPAILGAAVLSVVVPDARKAKAVRDSLLGPIHPSVPASRIRTHPQVRVFLDPPSAELYAAESKDVPLVDLQVNGYKGVDFSSVDLTLDAVAAATQGVCAAGTRAFMPTVISSSMRTYEHVLPILADACSSAWGRQALLGIHLEGPFLCAEEGAVGCHPPQHVLPPTVAVLEELLALGKGHVKLITMAATGREADAVIEAAMERGVKVSLGHHLAKPAEIASAAEAGAVALTHLGNGCPAMMHRHDNPFLGGLMEDRLVACVIADGCHLPLHVLQLILRVKTAHRVILVSDMAPVAGLPPGRYTNFGTEVEVDVEGFVRAPGSATLAGASKDLLHCVNHVLSHGLMSLGEVRLCGLHNPLNLIGVHVTEFLASTPHPSYAGVKATPGGGLRTVERCP